MTNDNERALELYRLALSLVEAKGAFISVGQTRLKEFRSAGLIIHYMPSSGHLDVWNRRKVLTVNRRDGKLMVTQYTPGEWEAALEHAAGKPVVLYQASQIAFQNALALQGRSTTSASVHSRGVSLCTPPKYS